MVTAIERKVLCQVEFEGNLLTFNFTWEDTYIKKYADAAWTSIYHVEHIKAFGIKHEEKKHPLFYIVV